MKCISIDTNILMDTNYTNKESRLIYPELSYLITGVCFEVHNILGRFGREKQYGDLLEEKLKGVNVTFSREFRFGGSGNTVDFLVDDKIVLEIKAKPLLLKEDFVQVQRYLQSLNKRLGLFVNFRNRYLKPIRVVKIETSASKRFHY